MKRGLSDQSIRRIAQEIGEPGYMPPGMEEMKRPSTPEDIQRSEERLLVWDTLDRVLEQVPVYDLLAEFFVAAGEEDAKRILEEYAGMLPEPFEVPWRQRGV